MKGYAVSKRGRPLVDQRNFKYVMNRCSKVDGKAWWKCVAYKRLKCRATAISKQNKILKFGPADHNHPASDCYFREPALWNIEKLQIQMPMYFRYKTFLQIPLTTLKRWNAILIPREDLQWWWIKMDIFTAIFVQKLLIQGEPTGDVTCMAL